MILGENQQFASPGEALEHFGVKGMKWGVRRERYRNLKNAAELNAGGSITRTTKTGEKFTVQPASATKLHRSLAAISKNYADAYAKGANLAILDSKGKKIGDAMFDHKDNGDLYLNWLGIDKSARGQGYATEVMKAAAEYGKRTGSKRMTLEVPGNSPDARHIYSKMGFRVTKEADPKDAKDDPLWGGLTEMEYRFRDD